MKDLHWSETINASDYVKSFLFDYFIPHDFAHPSLVHNYSLHSAYLRYSTDDITDSELQTYYMLVEKLSDSLDHYINGLDQVNGIGYYDTLCVLLRLAIVLVHCYRYGIVHNDIKPDNIMLTSEINDYDIRLIDFGEGFLGFDVLSSMDALRKGNAHTKYINENENENENEMKMRMKPTFNTKCRMNDYSIVVLIHFSLIERPNSHDHILISLSWMHLKQMSGA